MRVLVLAPYPLKRAPSQRFRWEQYVVPLGKLGIFLEPSSFLHDAALDVVHGGGAWLAKATATLAGASRRLRDALRARSYELVLVHRESSPLGPAWFERLLSNVGVPYAFDFDDAIYLPAASAGNRRLTGLKAAGKTKRVVGRAALVIAGNRHLAEWARRYNPRVDVVPTTIDTELYRPSARIAGERVCIGWSGSLSTIEHLKLLERVLRDLQRERGIRIKVIGDAAYQIPGAETESLRWNEKTELDDLHDIDIGVMPLPDDEWARGKCGLKGLQYMALGIPSVLSPVGVNTEIASDGAAMLASTPEDWYEVLGRLIDDAELRARIGAAGRVRVEEKYSVSAVLPLWEQALRQAAAA